MLKINKLILVIVLLTITSCELTIHGKKIFYEKNFISNNIDTLSSCPMDGLEYYYQFYDNNDNLIEKGTMIKGKKFYDVMFYDNNEVYKVLYYDNDTVVLDLNAKDFVFDTNQFYGLNFMYPKNWKESKFDVVDGEILFYLKESGNLSEIFQTNLSIQSMDDTLINEAIKDDTIYFKNEYDFQLVNTNDFIFKGEKGVELEYITFNNDIYTSTKSIYFIHNNNVFCLSYIGDLYSKDYLFNMGIYEKVRNSILTMN